MTTKLKNSALFRFDYNPVMGFGHAIRCQSLAGKLRENGWSVRAFVSDEDTAIHDPDLLQLKDFDGPIDIVPSTHSSLEDIAKSHDGQNTWLVVDGYHINHNLADLSPNDAIRRMRFSDWPQNVASCDLVLDLSSGSKPDDYKPFLGETTRLLLGTDYFVPSASLESSIKARQSAHVAARTNTAERQLRVFVSFGYGEVLKSCLDVIENIGPFVEKIGKIDFAVHEKTASDLAAHIANHHMADRIEVHPNCDYVYDLMGKADFAIGACGMTSWERCALSLPTLATALSHDQQYNLEKLVKNGAALAYRNPCWETTTAALSTVLKQFLGNASLRVEMSDASRSIIDGNGFERLLPFLE